MCLQLSVMPRTFYDISNSGMQQNSATKYTNINIFPIYWFRATPCISTVNNSLRRTQALHGPFPKWSLSFNIPYITDLQFLHTVIHSLPAPRTLKPNGHRYDVHCLGCKLRPIIKMLIIGLRMQELYFGIQLKFTVIVITLTWNDYYQRWQQSSQH